MVNKNVYGIILAGGIGSRFWPVSTREKPKQFHDILNLGCTLLQNTFERLSQFLPEENILIVTKEEYKEYIKKQLVNISDKNILLEPISLNTAPAIVYATVEIKKRNRNSIIIVSPSDHIVKNTEEFVNLGQQAIDFVEANKYLLTFGIKPLRPDTGYGYIRYLDDNSKFKKVIQFIEKPNKLLADKFIETKEYLWNSGIFVWKTDVFLQELYKHAKSMAKVVNEVFEKKHYNAGLLFEKLPSISIDKLLFEKSNNIRVLPAEFGWNDIGTWNSLFEVLPKTGQENAILGNTPYCYKSTGNLVITNKKIIVLENINDMIVVETEKYLLICSRENEQKLKDYVRNIELKK